MGNYSRIYEGNSSDLVYVLAFDPGGTTGWCAMGVKPGTLSGHWETPAPDSNYDPNRSLHEQILHTEYGQIDCGVGGTGHEIGTGRGHGDVNHYGEKLGVDKMLELALSHYPSPVIVHEEFTLEQQNKHGDLLYPIRVMAAFNYGFIKAYPGFFNPSEPSGAESIFYSRRVDAKTTCTDKRLRFWKLYDDGSGAHARDATRHAYAFLRNCRGPSMNARLRRWRAWPHVFADPFISAEKDIEDRIKKPVEKGERIQFPK